MAAEREAVRRRPAGMKLNRATLLLVLLALAGCAAIGPAAVGPPEGEWRLTGGLHDGDALTVPADAPITLTFAGDEVSGRAACNSYSGSLTVDGDRLSIGATSLTEMGCDGPVMEAEGRYIAALAEVSAWDRSGDVLTLRGENVELTYALVPPVGDASLVDTLWALDGLLDGETASSTVAGAERATLQLRDDGTLSGTTGCRAFDGRYEVEGTTVAVTDLVTDDRACPDVMAQDEHVLAVLRDGWSYEIAGNRLTLRAADAGLVYLAAEG
jgi:heat shock protein HslJ